MKTLLKKITEAETPFKPAGKRELAQRAKNAPKSPLQWYIFKINVSGVGTNPDEAWEDAIEGFMNDPGSAPLEFTTEPYEE